MYGHELLDYSVLSSLLQHPFLDYMRVLGIDLGGEALKGLKVS